VIASVLGPLSENLDEGLVPLRIPVATAAETATDPRRFAQHLVRTVIRYSTEILTKEELAELRRSAADTTSASSRERTRRIAVGAPKLIFDAQFASEVKSGAEGLNEELMAGEAVSAIVRLVDLFRTHGREPYWVIDDSDRWIRIEGADLSTVADAFFRQVVPMLAREINCGFVLAAHDEYATLDGYREAQELFSRVIPLPIPDAPASAISAILDHRIRLANVSTTAAELLDSAALELLAERYRESQSLRRMLATVNRATQHACSDRVAPITPDLVQTALADLL
jgi:hypothetical protein